MQVDPLAHVDVSAHISSGCVIEWGAYLGPLVDLEEDVRVGVNVTFADPAPGISASVTRVKRHTNIGANATIAHGVVIASNVEVRPGSVVTRSVPPNAIVEGNPAAIVGYVGADRSTPAAAYNPIDRIAAGIEGTPVKGVTVHNFPVIPDMRGNLSVGEFERQVPFLPKRFFMVYDVPSSEIRGEHAHRANHQFLVCVRGSCVVVADDGASRAEVLLSEPNKGIYLPPMTWGIQYKYTKDALLLVFASDFYDSADYIRDYDEFLRELS